VDALVPSGLGRLMHGQSALEFTQPGERPVTACSGDISSTQQHSIMGHATEEKRVVVVAAYMYICEQIMHQ